MSLYLPVSVVAGIVLLIVDYLQTLSLEVTHVWNRRWKLVDFLYIGCRYFAFVDISTSIIYRLNTTFPQNVCATLGFVTNVLYLVGMSLSESLMFVRLYALSGRNGAMKRYLIFQYMIFHALLLILMIRNLVKATYKPNVIPFVSACAALHKSKFIAILSWGLILLNELILSLISLWLGFQENRDTKNPIVQILYRDGMYFIASMTTLSAGNIIVNFVGPSIHKFFLAEIHRVMHTTLSARMILHVRELSQRRLIPQFTVRDGVLIELSAVEDRTTGTSE
ncbi:hypothetical protein DFP72DRAFT_177829 [Ephemerocybe angulata]|uniref:DUF6533 domain-containing protein n=1 Tax=Ephemerocybe angulata TaxID=980116 RepID=A0A8H6I675_9AGAR|nr:hypothetical protein DFP72DRAFT_177829 [Tulosesus angulatus]